MSVLGLLKLLDQSRFRTIVVPARANGKIAALFRSFETIPDPADNQPFVAPGQPYGPMKFARALRGLRKRVRFLRTHQVDLVHSNDGRTHADWALAARLAGVPLLWHHRGDPSAVGLRLLAPFLADRVLAVSSFALPRPGLWSAAGKAEVVHSPFDTDLNIDRAAARRALARELGVSKDALVLGYFGAFVPRKRPLIFIDAVARLRTQLDRPVIGVMFGEARSEAMEKAVLDRIAEHQAAETVRLMGYRTPGAYWIAACDQLVVPAVGEPFGRTIIEAMLVGTPVIAANSGGNIEAIQNGLGLLVPADDPDALSRACLHLAQDPAAASAMADRAAADARNRFGEARHCQRVSDVYSELTERRRMARTREPKVHPQRAAANNKPLS
jgi:glycosyltransferase involved in cell wall biosynthesis